MDVAESTEREAGCKNIFNKIIKEYFNNTQKELGHNLQEGPRTPNSIDQK